MATLLISCGGDDEPGDTLQAGTYEATTILVEPDGDPPIDVLDMGGSLTMTIADNGTVVGRFFVPGELDADMAGTAIVANGTVTFEQDADTFIRDLTFDIDGRRLLADEELGPGARYRVVLELQ